MHTADLQHLVQTHFQWRLPDRSFHSVYTSFAPKGLAVFLAATIGDIFTYVVTSCQLALAFPDQNFFASLVKFMGIFAVTQVPIAIAEGILSVMIFNVLAKNCTNELKQLNVI